MDSLIEYMNVRAAPFHVQPHERLHLLWLQLGTGCVQ